MYYPIFALLLLSLLASPLQAQSNSHLGSNPGQRIYLRVKEGTHLDLPRLQGLGVRIVSIRPDPSGEADALVEALVNEDMFRALRSAGFLQAAEEPSP